ncbi:uridine-cytidine kinase-like 1 isoform X3 [Etheostoma cragini]|uniref:uridine-cytidine kinase-like 1 isoform X3 n=1 Tax=Etheostoma cragini TaxID=417921 RepID=UPI00155E8EEA|nr:uridine-cytidine kinase-like 1 isoform X3 [Etheostoma cragini]
MSTRSDSGSGEDSLDRLLPPAGAPRMKSTSLNTTDPPLLRTGTRTVYTAGRPPWYDEHGAQSKEALSSGCVGAAPQGRPPWPIRSPRLWMCRRLCCCLWILSTR